MQAIARLQKCWSLPNVYFLVCPESRELRNIVLVMTEIQKSKPLRFKHESLSLKDHKWLQIHESLYSVSYTNPMKITKFANPYSVKAMTTGTASVNLQLRGFAVACWIQQFLYVTGGFTPGKGETNLVRQIDLNNCNPSTMKLAMRLDLPLMKEARTSHSS